MGRPIRNRAGERYLTNEGYWVLIIESFSATNCTIQFNDVNKTILKNTRVCEIKNGSIKNPYHPSVCGIGYFGIGKYNSQKGKVYQAWADMIKRCYSKNRQNTQPTYTICSVCKEWLNFQNYAEWYETNRVDNYQVDKDILTKGNKIYSPENCCFVPQEINALLTKSNSARGKYPIGVHKSGKKYIARLQEKDKKERFDTPEEAFECYKFHKENHIKKVANKYRGKITEGCYWALYNYQVEITD